MRKGKKPPPPRPTPRDERPPAGPLLAQAVAHHQAGRLADAEAAYRAVLRHHPDQPDALHLLGVVAIQAGDAAAAIPLIERAIDRNGTVADYHDNLGSALAGAGRAADAATAHARAIRLQPDFAQAWFNRGNALTAAGRAGAPAAFRRALALRPDYAKAWFNLGNSLRALGDWSAAMAAFARAAALAPTMAEAHNNLGDAMGVLGRLHEAIHHHRIAVQLRPDDPTARYNLGAALQQRGAFEEAEIVYRETLRRAPSHVGALNNLGSVLKRLGRAQQAELCHREALRLSPEFSEALYNLGNALYAQGKLAEATRCFEEALSRKPDLAAANFNLGRLMLQCGDLARGWPGFDRRFAAGEALPNRRIDRPRWQGERLNGRRLLVWREQGVGDEIMFASCYADVLSTADGPVTIEADRRLVSLFARSFPGANVRAETLDGEGRERVVPLDADEHMPAGTLPRLYRTRHAAFPARGTWLAADPAREAEWRRRVDALGPRLKVGICWRSHLVSDERRASYTDLADWGPLFALAGIELVNLQYGDCEAEIVGAERRFGRTLHRWPDLDLKHDFEGVAALIKALDLVITVATSVGELAGALGVPVWRFGVSGDWSMLGSGCRPWYPSMRLFVARAGESLPAVLGRVANALTALAPPPEPAPPSPRTDDAPRLFEQALALHRAGRIAEAASAYHAVLDVTPRDADALHLLGLTSHQLGRPVEAVARIRQALAIDPLFATARNNLGLVFEALGRDREAEAQFRAALALEPAAAVLLSHLGLTQQKLKRLDLAERIHRRALRLNPADAKHHLNLGAAMELQGRFDAAGAVYARAVALGPAFPDALNNIGTIARLTGRPASARAWVERARFTDPSFALADWNRGLLDLAEGRLASGWAGYERRFSTRTLQRGRSLDLPVWRGEALNRRRLLVWNEQGVGDEILFASCLPSLARLDGPVVVECDRRLVSLFARAFPWAEVRPESGGAAGCDLQIAAGSVPALVRRSLAVFDGRPFLVPDRDRVEVWRQRVAALGSGLKVGFGWRSQLVDAHRRAAYTGVEDWRPVLAVPGIVPVNLQYGDCAAELSRAESAFGVHIHQWPDLDLKDDFESVAALVAALDLVIVPATAAGELAGALGVPVWRLAGPDWTQLGTSVRPWFPSMRLIAPRPGERVADVLPRVASMLRALLRKSA